MSGTNSGRNPLIAQGVLNRLRGSITVPNFPQLNVTAPYLGKEGIRITIDGETTQQLPTMTGAVLSPEPYQTVSVRVPLLKTQGLSVQYKAQMELYSPIGDITVRVDASNFPDYLFLNCAIESVSEVNLSGDDAFYNVMLKGYYNINSSLWSLS